MCFWSYFFFLKEDQTVSLDRCQKYSNKCIKFSTGQIIPISRFWVGIFFIPLLNCIFCISICFGNDYERNIQCEKFLEYLNRNRILFLGHSSKTYNIVLMHTYSNSWLILIPFCTVFTVETTINSTLRLSSLHSTHSIFLITVKYFIWLDYQFVLDIRCIFHVVYHSTKPLPIAYGNQYHSGFCNAIACYKRIPLRHPLWSKQRKEQITKVWHIRYFLLALTCRSTFSRQLTFKKNEIIVIIHTNVLMCTWIYTCMCVKWT